MTTPEAPEAPSTPKSSSPWPLLGWVLFALAAAAVALAVLLGILMRAVILDVVSFWPAWVLAAVVAAVMWPLRRRGVARVGAVAPLLLFSWLVGAVGLHVTGWDQLPSSAGDLIGPEVGAAATAELSIDASGDVVLEAGSQRLYEIRLQRSGGTVGPAEALERATDESVVVRLTERPDAGWFEAAGWQVAISRTPVWALSITAAEADVDLATVSLRSLEMVADGRARLASPVGTVPVTVDGGVILEVPATSTVEVIGIAQVPNGWETTDAGTRFNGEGTSSYVITVAPGANVVIRQW